MLGLLLLTIVSLYSVAATVQCPPQYEKLCFCGFKVDSRGCPTCECKDPCENKKCDYGTKCVLKKSECTSNLCGVPRCEKCAGNCKMLCKSGFRVDINGCGICECIDPCERNPCPAGKYCQRKQVVCVTAPCYDVAECKCLQLKCKECKYGYEVDDDGCQTCKCLSRCAVIKCPRHKPFCYNGACHWRPKY